MSHGEHDDWRDWHWQQRMAHHAAEELLRRWDASPVNPLARDQALQRFRFSVTPYYARLMSQGALSLQDPLWRQVAPPIESDAGRPDAFDGARDNWEEQRDMLTPILQHKYPDRALIRLRNDCHAYCTFCLQALRVLDREKPKQAFNDPIWEMSVEVIRRTPAIREVIISGGEPLLFENARLHSLLREVREIPHVDGLRIHTRALTFNPFRVDDGLVAALRDTDVREVAFHVAHPRELTSDFKEAAGRLLESRALLYAHIPLLRGVNDDAGTLETLFRDLHRLRIRPYYLIHCMPFVPSVTRFRTSVRHGASIMRVLKRHVSNPLIPEYIVVHDTGKQTVPATIDGSSEFTYAFNGQGWPVVQFVNWRNELVEYLDSFEPCGEQR